MLAQHAYGRRIAALAVDLVLLLVVSLAIGLPSEAEYSFSSPARAREMCLLFTPLSGPSDAAGPVRYQCSVVGDHARFTVPPEDVEAARADCQRLEGQALRRSTDLNLHCRIGADGSIRLIDEDGVAPAAIVAIVAIWVAYLILLPLVWRGTVGKKLLRLKVVRVDGTQPSVGAHLVRGLFLPVDLACFLPGLITSLASDNRQRVGDRLAGTTVVAVHPPLHLAGLAPTGPGAGPIPGMTPGGGPSPSPWPGPGGPGGPIPPPPLPPSPARPVEGSGAHWDEARGTWVVRQPGTGRWLAWNPAAGAWAPLEG